MAKKRQITRVAIEKSPLFRVCRQKDLLRILRLEQAELKALLEAPPYSINDIVTPKGKTRHTETPVKRLRAAHERLAALLMQIEPPSFLYCPVKGRSHIDNASRHRTSRTICTLDVREYFPSTPSRRVYWFFRNVMKCSTDVSAVIAKLTTREGRLPTGSPLSPILAFFSFYDMWHAVAKIAVENNCIVTIYMDDVTISGAAVPGNVMWAIKRSICRAGLRYHKERRYADEPALVTGVIIDSGKLLIPHLQHLKAHKTREGLAMELMEGETRRLENKLRGLVNYRTQVRLANIAGRSITA